MKNCVALILLLSATMAFGATINLNKDEQPSLLDNITSSSNEYLPKAQETEVLEYDPFSPSQLSLSTPQNSFAVGRMIAEAAKTAVEVLSKMDLSEQGLKNLVQLIMPLIAIYLGPYTQVILPLLSGIAAVFFKSLAR